jgi:hypothetical protein
VSSTGATTLQESQILSTPKGVSLDDMLPLAAGVSMLGKPDVGDSNLGNRQTVITYGVGMTSGSAAILSPTLNVEGINTNTTHDGNSAVYLDAFAVAEAQFRTSGNNADVAYAGVDQVIQIRSGSNDFHGGVRGSFSRPPFQGNNINSILAGPPNNLKFSNPLIGSGYYDYSFDIGGRIVRDKLWFYSAYSKQSLTQGTVNTFAKPNAAGCWTCPDAVPAVILTQLPQYDFKASYQMTPSTKLIGAYLHSAKWIPIFSANASNPAPSVNQQHQPESVWKGEIQSAPSPRLFINGIFGFAGYHVHYDAQPGANLKQFGYNGSDTDVAGDPSQEELSSKFFTGPIAGAQDRPQNRYETTAQVSYIPSEPHLGGRHQLKFGSEYNWEMAGTRILKDKPSGDYLLLFNKGVPTQITLYNYPVPNSINNLYSQAGYVTDTYTVKRVTINAGVRIERYHSYYPTQTKPAGQFSNLFPAQTFQGKDVLTWKDVVPRVGVAWDLRGNGRTVVKGSFGLFGDTMGDLWPNNFNPDAINSSTYTWSGPCYIPSGGTNFTYDQYACDVDPSYLKLITPSTPLCTVSNVFPCLISSAGALTEILDPNLKQNKTREFSVRLERELVPNVALNVAWVYHGLYNLFDSTFNGAYVGATGINVGHPYSSYTQQATFVDTGRGSNTGSVVPVYTYANDASLCDPRGCSMNQIVNTPPSRPDIYHTLELALTKRYSKRWDALTSFWITKNHVWTQGVSGSPNDDRFPIDETWNWEARGNITYNLPAGISLSSLYRGQSGVPGQRMEVFTGTGTNGVKLTQGSVTLRMGPFGEFRGPIVHTLNFKGSKVFKVTEGTHFEVNVQVFNVLNGAGAVNTNYLTGDTTFKVISSIVSPRVLRLGGSFNF